MPLKNKAYFYFFESFKKVITWCSMVEVGYFAQSLGRLAQSSMDASNSELSNSISLLMSL